MGNVSIQPGPQTYHIEKHIPFEGPKVTMRFRRSCGEDKLGPGPAAYTPDYNKVRKRSSMAVFPSKK